MARQFMRGAVAASLCSALMFAGTQAATPKPHRQAASAQTPSRAPDRVTVVGCIERKDSTQPSSETTAIDSLSFVLIRPARTSPTGTSGMVDLGRADTAADADRLYRLDAPVAQLTLHVGQKVEVTGTVADRATSPAGAGSSANVPRLKVETVTVLDTACPR